jgi:hypothetical protein
MQALSTRTPSDSKTGSKYMHELGTLLLVLLGLSVCAILAPFLRE